MIHKDLSVPLLLSLMEHEKDKDQWKLYFSPVRLLRGNHLSQFPGDPSRASESGVVSILIAGCSSSGNLSGADVRVVSHPGLARTWRPLTWCKAMLLSEPQFPALQAGDKAWRCGQLQASSAKPLL